MKTLLQKSLLVRLALGGLLVTGVAACAHERLHYDLGAMHEEFHAQPHTRAEHRQFHDELGVMHEEAHERGYYGDGAYSSPYYDGGGYW